MRKVAFVFPGQGSQYIGMGRDLYESYNIAKETFHKANEVLGYDFKQLIFNGHEDELLKTENTQPAVFVTSIAMLNVLKSQINIEPTILAGHSLGEITALTAAEAISFEDALEIVKNRAVYMKEASEENVSTMYAIRNLHYKTVENLIDEFSSNDEVVVISNYNSVDQVVISGNVNSVERLKENLESQGALATKLKVSGAFHSPLMSTASDKLKQLLGQYKFNPLKYPVISNVNGKIYKDSEEIINNLSNQVIMPVQWLNIMRTLKSIGIDTTIELGAGKVLSNLLRKNMKYIETYNIQKVEDIEYVKENYKQKYQNYRHTVISKCILLAVTTENRNFNEQDYEAGVIDQYRKLQVLQAKLEEENREANLIEMNEAKEVLSIILNTKMIPEKEKKDKLKEVERMINYTDCNIQNLC